MFRKKGDKGASPLTERLQRIANTPALDDEAYQSVAPPPRPERPQRETTFRQATVQLLGGERLDVVVKNLSETGARIEFFRKVILSEYVVLNEPVLRLRTRARVVWQQDGAAGLHFVPG